MFDVIAVVDGDEYCEIAACQRVLEYKDEFGGVEMKNKSIVKGGFAWNIVRRTGCRKSRDR